MMRFCLIPNPLQAAERCTARISQRGLGHLSLVPQATDAAAVVRAAGEETTRVRPRAWTVGRGKMTGEAGLVSGKSLAKDRLEC